MDKQTRNLTVMFNFEIWKGVSDTQIEGDPRLRRQTECLNAARNAPDIISQIRWAYQVLEQEQLRNAGYTPPDAFRHIRNGVSHPELGKPAAKTFFRSSPINAEAVDLRDPKHYEFLARQAKKIIVEAERIVENALSDRRFWA